MDLEITPEPSEDERQAIVEALRLEAATESELTQWRRPVLDEADASQTFAGPARSTWCDR